MKKTLYLLLLAFMGHSFIAQNYYPLPDSNAVWTSMNGIYLTRGDSTYNALQYTKYYYTSDTALSLGSQVYLGMLRQDIPNKKIYGIKKGSQTEYLLYHFNLQLNDTLTVEPIDLICFPASYKLKVIHKDSVLLRGVFHQRMTLTDNAGGSSLQDTWIEGIGSLIGPLTPGLFPYCATDVCSPKLLCQKQNGIFMYQDSIYPCNYRCPTGIEKQSATESALYLYPNPTEQYMEISSQGIGQIRKISLYTLMGSELKSYSPEVLGENLKIDLGALEPGIYFVSVQSQKGTFVKKICKN